MTESAQLQKELQWSSKLSGGKALNVNKHSLPWHFWSECFGFGSKPKTISGDPSYKS